MAGAPLIPIPGTGGIVELQFGFSDDGGFSVGIGINWVQVLIDLIEALIALFTGRPREEATMQVAKRLNGARFPGSRIASLLYWRALQDFDIVISASDSGDQAILGQIFSSNVEALVANGATRDRANFIATFDLSRDAQGGAPLLKEENEQLNPKLKMWGQGHLQIEYDNHLSYLHKHHPDWTGAKLNKHAQRMTFEHANWDELLSIRWSEKKPPNGGPPEIPPPPPPPVLDGDGDEITDLGYQLSTYLYYLSVVASTLSASPPTDSGACCARVVGSLNTIVVELTAIATAISGAGGITVDLAPLTAELKCICDKVAALPPAMAADTDKLVAAVDSVTKAISSGTATDLKPVVDAVNAFAKIVDVKPATIDYLVKQGFINKDLAQVVTSADFGDWLIGTINTWLYDHIEWLGKKLGFDVHASAFSIDWTGGNLVKGIAAALQTALAGGAEPIYPIVRGLVEGVAGILVPRADVTIHHIHVDPDLVLSKTLAPILIVNGIALLTDYFGWEISEQLKEYVDLAAEFLGLQEVRELKIGQRMRFGPMRIAEQEAKAMYRQELPGAGAAYGLAAQGLITHQVAHYLAALNGTPSELTDAISMSAYRGLNPRQMLRLIETGLFSHDEIADELTFAGMRPVSQHRMLHAAPYLATQPERHRLRAELEKAYVAGFLTDQQLVDDLDAAEHDVDRNSLTLRRAHWETRELVARELEAEYSTLYLGNLIDLHTYKVSLSGLGLQDWRVNSLTARYEARAAATLARQDAAAARALARATAAEERKVAIRNFIDGHIDGAALALALIATGLTATQAAAYVDMALLQRTGATRSLFGLRLAPAQATLLRERITALSDQRKRLLIKDGEFVAALHALGLGPRYINALRAAVDASVTPAKSATVVPVETT